MSTQRTAKVVRTKAPKLGLTPLEQRVMRGAKIRSSEVSALGGEALFERVGGSLSRERCDEIAALAEFQRLGSVGLETARDFVALGFRSVSELKRKDPRELFARMCELTDSRQDPCVEDVFRCAIAQAEDPHLPVRLRDWWLWTSVRGQPRSARP